VVAAGSSGFHDPPEASIFLKPGVAENTTRVSVAVAIMHTDMYTRHKRKSRRRSIIGQQHGRCGVDEGLHDRKEQPFALRRAAIAVMVCSRRCRDTSRTRVQLQGTTGQPEPRGTTSSPARRKEGSRMIGEKPLQPTVVSNDPISPRLPPVPPPKIALRCAVLSASAALVRLSC
jgi:hypothetical protein